jgi:hypothetical protein
MWLSVDPAPPRLPIISPNILAEGEPVQALLQEDYTNSPIPGQIVVFEVGGKTVSAPLTQAGLHE